jgi:hypothetical protein
MVSKQKSGMFQTTPLSALHELYAAVWCARTKNKEHHIRHFERKKTENKENNERKTPLSKFSEKSLQFFH